MAKMIVISKIEEVEEVELAEHVKATARSLFGRKTMGSKNMQLFYSRFEVDGETYLHTHKVESGHFILGGKLLFVSGEGEQLVEKNTAIFIPPLIKHKFKNVGDEAAYMLSVFSPPEVMYET